MEQVHSVEYDASRMQVPTDFISVIRYFRDAQGDDDYAKEAKKLLQSELIRLVEKVTGKPLTSYITDLRAFGAEPL
ncbi:MAG: hypothetical protein NZZ41_02795 [Candidatus Dojkabacteria bacterium]|nr:hypothetical protein [Candidatus Dojkabacteria bacterium]